MTIKTSTKPGKKLMAVFTKENGRTKTAHFGAKGMDDYTLTKNEEQRKRYRSRHRKDLQTGDFTKPGFLAWYILWGDSTSRQQNIKSYKKRFNL